MVNLKCKECEKEWDYKPEDGDEKNIKRKVTCPRCKHVELQVRLEEAYKEAKKIEDASQFIKKEE